VDGILLTTVNMATFAGGIYDGYLNGAVGAGGAGGVFWVDNFKVGAPPELIETLDYADTFTTNDVRTDGFYGDNANGAYNVEDLEGNPLTTWTPQTVFSFNTPASSTNPDLLGAATGNGGAATGFAQSGGGDFSFAYGLRSNYVVQLDGILPADRLDISSLPNAGDTIFTAQSLSVFFRLDSTAGQPHPAFPEGGLPGMGVYNGSVETAVTDAGGHYILTGVDDANWHKFAVNFDQLDNSLRLYVDGNLRATLDLATFGGGVYQDYLNGAVGAGGGAGAVFWVDNFKVGSAAAPPVEAARLTVSAQGGSVVISWTGAGTLEEATAVSGPWTAIENASSPYSVTPDAGAKFYRVSQ